MFVRLLSFGLVFIFAMISAAWPLPSFASDASLQSSLQGACEAAVACPLGTRSYHVLPPEGWDGRTVLPVLLHFHGWGRQGPLIMKHSRIAGATKTRGVLLVAPNGAGRTWNFWTRDTEDVAFADAVLKDLRKRFPIDASKIFVSGYSYGGAMAWRFACHSETKIAAVFAVSGFAPLDNDTCERAVSFRHVHGTSDTVMRYPFGDDGDVEAAVAYWRQRNGCGDARPVKSAWQAVEILPFIRHRWSKCASGQTVTLDVHEKGHFIPRFWIARQLDEVL
ncbi:MAG: polyhydroxybutyrate depolymerase [Pseudomonadota bacterium]